MPSPLTSATPERNRQKRREPHGRLCLRRPPLQEGLRRQRGSSAAGPIGLTTFYAAMQETGCDCGGRKRSGGSVRRQTPRLPILSKMAKIDWREINANVLP
jgi:hypothetical protein